MGRKSPCRTDVYGGALFPTHDLCICSLFGVSSLLNALCLRDEAFGHTAKTGNHHQANTTGEPAAKATAAFVVPGRHAQAGDADHRSDDVAAPVHDV
jgi:hypothetical protein